MAEQIPTPTDELTGIPLSIVPNDEVLDHMPNSRSNAAARAAAEIANVLLRAGLEDGVKRPPAHKGYADINHAYHPSTAAMLASPDGKAVRASRGQVVMRYDHDQYHAIYSGPALPRNAEERFRAIVLCAAGYIPRQAMDFSGTSSTIVDLSDAQIERLQTKGEMRVVQIPPVRCFLENYVIKNSDTDRVPRQTIDDFIKLSTDPKPKSSYDIQRQQRLAHRLLLSIIDPATEPLHDVFRQIRQAGMWLPREHRSPRHVVQRQLIGTRPESYPYNVQRIGKKLCTVLVKRRDGELSAA